jgi:hypothetical protein
MFNPKNRIRLLSLGSITHRRVTKAHLECSRRISIFKKQELDNPTTKRLSTKFPRGRKKENNVRTKQRHNGMHSKNTG